MENMFTFTNLDFNLDPHQIVHTHCITQGLGKGPLSATLVMVRGSASKMCSFFGQHISSMTQ